MDERNSDESRKRNTTQNMTDDNPDDGDDEGVRIIDGKTTISGTIEFEGSPTDLRIRTDDGDMTARDVTVETEDQYRERLAKMREEAPDPECLTDGQTCDIDEVIEALQAAKERGVDTIYVNDDGLTRPTRPWLTHNLEGRSSMAPQPKELNEYVEL